MTTLQAIGFTCVGGSIVLFLSLLAFGIAVRKQSQYVAPRCAARPKKVIFNPKPEHPDQNRGSALLGWIRWTMGLTYDTMLKGVPGTGTRKNGLEGSMLQCTLDGIVLIRFNELCFRITKVVTFICLCFILPMNLTARCYDEQQKGNNKYPGCESGGQHNLTNYDRTTLANIPALEEGVTFGSLVGRMYGIALCTWVITMYACYLVRIEWIELLAMRRAYYLEANVWEDRKDELRETLLKDDDSEDEQAPSPLNRNNRDIKRSSTGEGRKGKRPPWIPHPEQRDTVPNVALYSILVGNLPSLPQQAIYSEEDVEAAVASSKKMSIDWQLALTTAFFDQCVPNQPGYSSSVAAVTILPGATDLAKAWSRWYVAAGKLRRLRYIRKLIGELRHYDIEDHSDDEEVPPATPQRQQLSHSYRRSSGDIYRNSIRKKNYFREVLGSAEDEEVEANFLLSFDYGPEQFAVYSREFAQSAAACCPNGCGERRLRQARIDELLVMEQDAIAEVQAANEALEKAQETVTKTHHDHSDHFSPPSSPITSPLSELKRLNLSESLETEAALLSRPIMAKVRSGGSQSLGDLVDQLTPQDQAQSQLPETSPPVVFFGGDALNSSSSTNRNDPWSRVQNMVNEAHNKDGSLRSLRKPPDTGAWELPSFADIKTRVSNWKKVAANTTDQVVDTLARETSYAVVTFTSRQAAVAARHCLADGRGVGRWIAAGNIPVPPLADAAPFLICPCRGCCRPVTMNIDDRQKACRRYITLLVLAAIYIFYTIPLTLATGLVDPQKWAEAFSFEWNPSLFYTQYLSGLLPALLWTGFFAFCPLMFKFLANFGSNALSVLSAEYTALQYYWWFMIITAFSGNSLSTMFINGFSISQSGGISIGTQAQQVLARIASAIPTQISAQWLNWIIVRTTITLPLHYLLQINTFVFSCLGWHCCSRMVRGGGPGGPVPYRVFIDTGVVLLCVVALAPASPLVAPFGLIHFCLSEPLLRRNIIFMYRPKFDGGGIRWPFLFEMIMSCLLFSHILMITMLALKKAVGPAVVAFVPFFPTLLFKHEIGKLYLKPYLDAGLVQTSMLDGWDNRESTSQKKREEFRRFLVDAHKASYVPVCIAGSKEIMTAEPAVVIAHDNDEGDPSTFLPKPGASGGWETSSGGLSATGSHNSQFGVAMRRVTPRSLERTQATRHFDFSGNGSSGFNYITREQSIAEEEHDDENITLQAFNTVQR
jgi:hypothetical protein